MSGRRIGWRATASIARRLATVWLETCPKFSPVTRTSAASRSAIASATRPPRRRTANPHVLCIDPARFCLILHAANERAAVRENGQAMALHFGDEDTAGPARRPEDGQAIRDGLHVDHAVVDRIEGNRIAPAK